MSSLMAFTLLTCNLQANHGMTMAWITTANRESMKGDRVNSTQSQCAKVIPRYFHLTPDTPRGSRNSVTRFSHVDRSRALHAFLSSIHENIHRTRVVTSSGNKLGTRSKHNLGRVNWDYLRNWLSYRNPLMEWKFTGKKRWKISCYKKCKRTIENNTCKLQRSNTLDYNHFFIKY